MSKYVILKKDESSGCCNLILWDSLLIIFLTSILGTQKFHIHLVFCIIIGIIISGIVFALMQIKYIGAILQIVCGIFWAICIWSLLNEVFHFDKIQDPIWDWTIKIVIGLFSVGFHFVSNQEIIKESSDTNADISNPHIRTYEPFENVNASQNIYTENPWNPNEFSTFVKKFENAAELRDQIMTAAAELINTQHSTRLLEVFEENEEVWTKSSSNLEMIVNLMQDVTNTKEARKLLQRAYDILNEMEKSTATVAATINKVKKEHQSNHYHESNSHDPEPDKASTSDSVSSLFIGVKTQEELKKRYLSLIKIYHPDNHAGDTEMTKKIQQEYERLMKQYKH